MGNPLSITQAFNWLKDKKNNLVDMVKKDVKEQAKISIAPPQHRREFLTYSISLLRSVSGENERQFFRISRKSPRLYSNTELAEFYRKLLTLRTHGYTIQAIAHFLHTEVEVLEKVEHLAMAAVEEAIEKAKVGAIPILGG